MTSDPIQDQLIQARRNQILDAATTVFAEKGFHRATIRDVAKAAGIADGTIYNYFDNKTGLMMGILNRLNETGQREQDLAELADADINDLTKSYLRHRFEIFRQNGSEILQVVLSEVLVDAELRQLYMTQIIQPTFALSEPFFAQMVAAGKLRAIDVPLMLRAISSMFLGIQVLHIMGEPTVQDRWEDLPDFLTDMILNGIKGAE